VSNARTPAATIVERRTWRTCSVIRLIAPPFAATSRTTCTNSADSTVIVPPSSSFASTGTGMGLSGSRGASSVFGTAFTFRAGPACLPPSSGRRARACRAAAAVTPRAVAASSSAVVSLSFRMSIPFSTPSVSAETPAGTAPAARRAAVVATFTVETTSARGTPAGAACWDSAAARPAADSVRPRRVSRAASSRRAVASRLERVPSGSRS
jgi:hypothetical protein